MVIYSVIFFILKILDFSDISTRLKSFHMEYIKEESFMPENIYTLISKGLATGKVSITLEQLNKCS